MYQVIMSEISDNYMICIYWETINTGTSIKYIILDMNKDVWPESDRPKLIKVGVFLSNHSKKCMIDVFL